MAVFLLSHALPVRPPVKPWLVSAIVGGWLNDCRKQRIMGMEWHLIQDAIGCPMIAAAILARGTVDCIARLVIG
jgi:hypothetical protein